MIHDLISLAFLGFQVLGIVITIAYGYMRYRRYTLLLIPNLDDILKEYRDIMSAARKDAEDEE